MHGKAIVAALFALAAGASAQTPIDPSLQQSVLLVLATAIPSDVAAHAIADPLAFASEIGSSIAAGNTPAWYQALPTDVLSLLPQVYPEATPTPSASMYATPAPSSAAASTASASSALTGVISANSTSRAVQSPTMSTATSTAIPTGAASFPTAAVGASVGAVLGFLGLIAL